MGVFFTPPTLTEAHEVVEDRFWPRVLYVTLVHIAAVVGLFVLPFCQRETLLWASILAPISCLGITVGAHRLWSHRSFEAALPVRIVLMLCHSIAFQGSILKWSHDHRVHHKYTDTDADPHNSRRGFFFAHIGWLFSKGHSDFIQARRLVDVSDLLADPVVVFQHKHIGFSFYMCLIMPAQVANCLWGEDFWRAFFVAGALRNAFVLHATFLINSAAHLFGDHPYDVQSYASENPIVSFFTVGEGWHNWHHKYPHDYAASEFGISSQFNLSKLVIDLLAMLGLVWNRKRGTTAWAARRHRLDRDTSLGIPLPILPPPPLAMKKKRREQSDAAPNNGHSIGT